MTAAACSRRLRVGASPSSPSPAAASPRIRGALSSALPAARQEASDDDTAPMRRGHGAGARLKASAAEREWIYEHSLNEQTSRFRLFLSFLSDVVVSAGERTRRAFSILSTSFVLSFLSDVAGRASPAEVRARGRPEPGPAAVFSDRVTSLTVHRLPSPPPQEVHRMAAACNSHTYKGRYPVRARLVSEGCDTRLTTRRCRMPSRRRTHRTLLTQQAAKERIGAQARLRCHCLLHRCCRRRRSPKVEAERKEAKEEGLERRMAAVCWLLRRL